MSSNPTYKAYYSTTKLHIYRREITSPKLYKHGKVYTKSHTASQNVVFNGFAIVER